MVLYYWVKGFQEQRVQRRKMKNSHSTIFCFDVLAKQQFLVYSGWVHTICQLKIKQITLWFNMICKPDHSVLPTQQLEQITLPQSSEMVAFAMGLRNGMLAMPILWTRYHERVTSAPA